MFASDSKSSRCARRGPRACSPVCAGRVPSRCTPERERPGRTTSRAALQPRWALRDRHLRVPPAYELQRRPLVPLRHRRGLPLAGGARAGRLLLPALSHAHPNPPNRPEVEAQIAVPRAAAPRRAPIPAAPTISATRSAFGPGPAPNRERPAPSSERSVIGRWWFWTAVGARSRPGRHPGHPGRHRQRQRAEGAELRARHTPARLLTTGASRLRAAPRIGLLRRRCSLGAAACKSDGRHHARGERPPAPTRRPAARRSCCAPRCMAEPGRESSATPSGEGRPGGQPSRPASRCSSRQRWKVPSASRWWRSTATGGVLAAQRRSAWPSRSGRANEVDVALLGCNGGGCSPDAGGRRRPGGAARRPRPRRIGPGRCGNGRARRRRAL